jgi:aminoglycoside 3-N-acetyltransferase
MSMSPRWHSAANGCATDRQIALGHSQEAIARDLRQLGLQLGATVLVHASLKSMGWVEGGAAAAVASLRGVLGSAGTLVVPTGTADNSDSSRPHLAKVYGMDKRELQRYYDAMPGFDPASTPSTGMGAIAEAVRTAPGASRSRHPQSSFAALGALAKAVTGDHAESCHLGESSPLGRLYDLDAQVLLLGVGYESCSAFHLAEYRYAPGPPIRTYRCVVMRDGMRRWHEYEDVDLDDRDFGEVGREFDATGAPRRGVVAESSCRLFALRSAVDFAVGWMRHHRERLDDVRGGRHRSQAPV